MTANASWIPSSLVDFNYTDCESAKYFFNTLSQNQTRDIPVLSTYYLVIDGLSNYWDARNISVPDASDILGWAFQELFVPSNTSLLMKSTFNFIDGNETCKNSICQSLDWQGNSDQAGRGMLVTYCLEAAAVTLYLTVLVCGITSWRNRSESIPTLERTCRSRLWSALLEATRESLRSFLDAALFFCLAMQIAAMSVFVHPRRHRTDTITLSSAIMAAFTALFTIFPALALSSWTQGSLRRVRIRTFLWFLIALFNIVTFILFIPSKWLIFHSTPEARVEGELNDRDNQGIWEEVCLDQSVMEEYTRAFIILFALLWGTVSFYLVFVQGVLRYFHFKKRMSTSRYRKLRKCWSILSTALSLLAMWASLGVFDRYRKEMSQRAGDTNKDHVWTFGQILSVLTFAPVPVEFILVFHFGAEVALSGLVSRAFKVVVNDADHKIAERKAQSESKV